jgi:Tfp pilus assembly protein PilO
MNRNAIIEKLTSKRVKDYSFTIIFFIVFSFFIIFAIRPNLTTVFSLQKQLKELRALDASYENVIIHIVDLQSLLETNRDNMYLLDEALPGSPQVNKVIDDLKRSASESGVPIRKIDIGEVNLKEDEKKKDIKGFTLSLETNSNFVEVKSFIDLFMNQRRLKMVRNLSIIKDTKDGTGSASLKIKMDISGYYL